ncbi:MAG: GAF domain-containing protein [Deltaproteobacteria bacterium]|nr:GAF domain-containing protein [Deltaproteobacteria bacterium]
MKKEVSCINTRAVLDYVKEFKPEEYTTLFGHLDPEIDNHPDPEDFLRDPNNWISCTIASEIYKRARLILKDEMAAYKIAKHAVEKTSLGYTQQIIVKAFWSYNKALKHIQRLNDKWNRNKKVELVENKMNNAVVRLHWNPQMDVSKDLCLYNQGAYVFFPIIWGGIPISLEEKCCFFKGAPYCEFHLSWSFRNRFHEVFSRFFSSRSVIMETVMEMEKDKKIIEEKYDEVNRLNLELNFKIKQLTAIQETGKAILSVLDINQLLTVIMNILSNVCQVHRALIMLVNEEKGYLEYLYAVGFPGGVPQEIMDYKIPLSRVSNTMARVANTGKSEYIPEVNSSLLNRENILLVMGKPTSVYVVPLITRSRIIGIIASDAIDGEGIPKEIRETVEVFAPQIAIAIDNARLYSKLQEQMEKLKRSQDLLSRADKLSFFGNLAARLAHEIKNPMVAIRTFLQILPQKYDDEEFRKEFYNIALEETDRVNNLLTELLDLVKTRESCFELTDLHVLIERMILLISPQYKSKQIKIVKSFNSRMGLINLDPEKMKQVILNLLSNAIEFTPKGGKIEIGTKEIQEKGDLQKICIEIKDNGPGIPQANIHKIFDPYFTTKHKSSLHNGTGLGLFIAYQNMLDHQGTIEVESKINEGTKFTLSLPATLPKGKNPMSYSIKSRGFAESRLPNSAVEKKASIDEN